MRAIFTRQGIPERLAARIEEWLPLAMQHTGGAVPIEQIAAIVAQAMAAAIEETASRAPPPTSSPLINPQPPPLLGGHAPLAPPPLLPQDVVYGRSAKGNGPGPVPLAGPTPPHVQIGGSLGQSAQVQIHSPGGAEGAYAGNLSPGQTRVELARPSGDGLPQRAPPRPPPPGNNGGGGPPAPRGSAPRRF